METANMVIDNRYISFEIQEELERLKSLIPAAIKDRAANMVKGDSYQTVIPKAQIYSAIEEIAGGGVQSMKEFLSGSKADSHMNYLLSDEDTDAICAFKNFIVTGLVADLNEDSSIEELNRVATERLQAFDVRELDGIVDAYRMNCRAG